MADLCALTVAEARAILIADDALVLSFAAREECGRTFGIEEHDAWRRLVESATARITAYERPVVAPTPYPGGNEPDGQTLFMEAVATAEEKRRETIEGVRARLKAVRPPKYIVPDRPLWRVSTVSTKRLLHAFRVAHDGVWSLCGLAQLVNTVDFDPALFQDRCRSCVRFARRYEESRA